MIVGEVKVMTVELKPWDVAEYLDTPERIALYIEAVIEDGDPALLAATLGDIARARGMAQIAKETGRSRESLYRALSDKGNPELTTLIGVLKALGLQLSVKPIAPVTT
jgi:probable addiction module antidote protein